MPITILGFKNNTRVKSTLFFPDESDYNLYSYLLGKLFVVSYAFFIVANTKKVNLPINKNVPNVHKKKHTEG